MIKELLEQIKRVSKASAILGDLIQAPPHAEHKGTHLLINCRYPLTMIHIDSMDPIFELRQEIPAMLKTVVASGICESIKSVSISAYVPYEDEFTRIYRYNVLTSKLKVGNEGSADELSRSADYSEVVNSRLLDKLKALE